MRKHGAYIESGNGSVVFYWMGERVDLNDFNERLIGMTKGVGEQIDMFVQGFEAKASLNEGQKTVVQLEELEKVARLPLCKDCRKLIGEAPQ